MIALAAAAASKSPSAWDQPGTLGFLVVFGMGIILFFVFRSLGRHLRKINEAARLELQAKPAESGPAGSESDEPRNDFVRTDYERQQSEPNSIDLEI